MAEITKQELEPFGSESCLFDFKSVVQSSKTTITPPQAHQSCSELWWPAVSLDPHL